MTSRNSVLHSMLFFVFLSWTKQAWLNSLPLTQSLLDRGSLLFPLPWQRPPFYRVCVFEPPLRPPIVFPLLLPLPFFSFFLLFFLLFFSSLLSNALTLSHPASSSSCYLAASTLSRRSIFCRIRSYPFHLGTTTSGKRLNSLSFIIKNQVSIYL